MMLAQGRIRDFGTGAKVLRPLLLLFLQSEISMLTVILRTGHTFRHKAAGAMGPDLAKKLSQLVKMEKNVMRSMELVSRERMEVAVSL